MPNRVQSVVWGLESQRAETCQAEDVTLCRIGHNVKFNHHVLSGYFWREPDSVDLDLLTIVGMVCFADRFFKRASGTWARDLLLQVPVENLSVWQDDKVIFWLAESLRFLTGDFWRFDFRARLEPHDRSAFLFRPAYEEPVYVMPYSGGLDSYAGYKLFRARELDRRLILVSTVMGGKIRGLLNSTIEHSSRSDSLRIPISFHGLPHTPEPTYRTRTFLYFMLAAVAAKFSGAEAVLIPENGQGALGPSLVPWGSQHPFQSSHPAFAHRIGMLLESIWGSLAPRFEYPNIWCTKAEVLRRLSEVDDSMAWRSTVSCGFNPRRAKRRSALPDHCGVCGGCLLRRLALFSGGLPEIHEAERYLWEDLTAASLGAAVSPLFREDIKTSDSDEGMAQAAVIDHQSLACLAGELSSALINRASMDLSEALRISKEEVLLRVRGLLIEHKNQWENLLEFAGPGSWLVRVVEVCG